MAYRNVQAGRGVEWLTEAGALVMKNPAAFLLMGLLVAVISVVPVLGTLALVVLGPTFYAGVMSAARSQHRQGSASFPQLFDGFQQEGKLPKLLALCLPGVAAGVLLLVATTVVVGGAMLGGGAAATMGGDEAAILAALGGGLLVLLVIALVVGFIAHALVFFAVPRVMFDGVEPFPAMKESWSAVLANIAAVLVFVVLLGLAMVVLAGVLGWIIPVVGQVLAMMLLISIGCVGMWIAYRDVFGDITQETPAATVPAAPAPPPPATNEGGAEPPAPPAP